MTPDLSDEEANALIDAATRLRLADRFDEALACYRDVVARRPDHPKATQHLGALLGQLGRYDEAEAMLRHTLTLVPRDAATRHSLAGVLMAKGRYPEAWSFYDARFEAQPEHSPRPALDAPQWRSWHLGGKELLVFPEQGLGDQIQFARFLPGLAVAGARVTVLAPPPLVRLFAASMPDIRVLAAAGRVDFPDPDFWVMSADLPGLAGATLATLPVAPYLRATLPAPALPSGFKVGLMTQGNPRLAMDARRSLPPDVAARLRAALPGTVVGLHPDESGARDFADTAAIVAALDLVVSVDTAVAHLAGAMGKRCLTLIRGFAPDWRWMADRDDSPWYPSMTLYRGTVAGDWTDAVARLLADARALAVRS